MSEHRTSVSKGPVSRELLIRFNPFTSLVTSDLSGSFYGTLSIYNALSVVSCDRLVHREGLSCVSMDDSLGFIMATQGRHPDSVFYTLYREDWDVSRSGVDLNSVMQLGSDLEELEIYTLSSNPGGVDLCFCSTPSTLKLEVARSLTRGGGSLIIWVDKLVAAEWIELLVSSFFKVIAYKPATASSIHVDFYLVCTGRGPQPAATLNERVRQVKSQLSFIEQYRARCLEQVLSGVDNTSLCDVHLAKLEYLSV